MTSSSRARQRGFTYLAALIAVILVGASLAAFSETWSHARQREKEAELLWIGNQFKQAIGLYYQRSPGAVKRYPEKLEDLLEDKRFLTRQRYLRKIYPDPLTGKAQWGLVAAPGGGVMGVHSVAEGRPRKTTAFPEASGYRNWRFVYEPPLSSSSALTKGRQAARRHGSARSDARAVHASLRRTSAPLFAPGRLPAL